MTFQDYVNTINKLLYTELEKPLHEDDLEYVLNCLDMHMAPEQCAQQVMKQRGEE